MLIRPFPAPLDSLFQWQTGDHITHLDGRPLEDILDLYYYTPEARVTTLNIQHSNGETILVTHDTNLPRPYSLNFEVQGEKGISDFDYHTRRIYIEGVSKPHQWEDMNKAPEVAEGEEVLPSWLEKYDHPLWQKYGEYAAGSGHGGMDFFVDHAFVESVKRQESPPLDAYDAAAWSAISPLSERSITEGNAPQYFPDFTRGKWIKHKPIFATKGDEY